MEEYNKIYSEVPKEAPKDKIYPETPKDGKTFCLQQSCRVLENLEKEAKHYASVRKSTKDVTTSCQELAHQQELFRFVSVVLESEQLFLGLVFLSPHHLEALALFVGL